MNIPCKRVVWSFTYPLLLLLIMSGLCMYIILRVLPLCLLQCWPHIIMRAKHNNNSFSTVLHCSRFPNHTVLLYRKRKFIHNILIIFFFYLCCTMVMCTSTQIQALIHNRYPTKTFLWHQTKIKLTIALLLNILYV